MAKVVNLIKQVYKFYYDSKLRRSTFCCGLEAFINVYNCQYINIQLLTMKSEYHLWRYNKIQVAKHESDKDLAHATKAIQLFNQLIIQVNIHFDSKQRLDLNKSNLSCYSSVM